MTTVRCLECLTPATMERVMSGKCGCGRAFLPNVPNAADLARLMVHIARQQDNLKEARACLDHPGANVRRHARKRIPWLEDELAALLQLQAELTARPARRPYTAPAVTSTTLFFHPPVV